MLVWVDCSLKNVFVIIEHMQKYRFQLDSNLGPPKSIPKVTTMMVHVINCKSQTMGSATGDNLQNMHSFYFSHVFHE